MKTLCTDPMCNRMQRRAPGRTTTISRSGALTRAATVARSRATIGFVVTFTLILVLILGGCASAPPPIDANLLPTLPAQFKEGDGRWTVATPAENVPRGEWWKAFSDPVLDGLIELFRKAREIRVLLLEGSVRHWQLAEWKCHGADDDCDAAEPLCGSAPEAALFQYKVPLQRLFSRQRWQGPR